MSFKNFVNEVEIIDFSKKKKEKASSEFRNKIANAVAKFPEVMANQTAVEKEVVDAVVKIKQESKTTKAKFKSPVWLKEFAKGTNPVNALHLALAVDYDLGGLIRNLKYNRQMPSNKVDIREMSEQGLFAIRSAYKIKDEVVKYIEEDIKKFEALEELCKKAIAPQYPWRTVSYAIHEWKSMKEFYEKELPRYEKELKELGYLEE